VLTFTSQIPDFEANALDGRTWRLSDLTGKVTLIDIWSTNCGPCRKEHPELQALYNESSLTRGLQILTFALDDDPARVRSYMAQKRYTFPVIVNPPLSVRLITSDGGIPKQFVINQQGRLSEPFLSWSLGRIFLEAARFAASKWGGLPIPPNTDQENGVTRNYCTGVAQPLLLREADLSRWPFPREALLIPGTGGQGRSDHDHDQLQTLKRIDAISGADLVVSNPDNLPWAAPLSGQRLARRAK
jgi:thiol-disulfide isomerase/thioredoxin